MQASSKSGVFSRSKNRLSLNRNGISKTFMRENFADWKNMLEQNTKEYCENTTLHGLKYLTKEDLYPIEKIFFALAIISVMVTSVFFISNVYTKWSTTPVIFSINPQPTHITKEPFPAVTICNLNQAYKSKAEQYSVYSTEFAMIQMLCKRDVNVTIADSITDWSNLRDFIVDISQPCNDMLLTCRFGAVHYNCSQLFHPVVTDGGLCCVFNMVHPSYLYVDRPTLDLNVTNPYGVIPVKWTTETGYPSELPKMFTPRTAIGTGETLGLSITLDVESENYYCSSSNSIGFKILLHNPTEVPNMREIGLLLSPGRETKVRIRVEKTESDQQLRTINKRYRQCVFEDEQKLQIFQKYTQRNCEIECVANMLLRYCGCISHYMPMKHDNETICSIYDATCVERVRLNSMRDVTDRSCPEICLPSCYDLTYLPDFFTTPLSHSGFQIVNQVVKNISSSYVERNIAMVNIYFKENSYRSDKQTEFIGMTDFLSSVGGLIGLFFGFSFISLAEIIYYAIMRPARIAFQEKRRIIKTAILRRNSSKQYPFMSKHVDKHLKQSSLAHYTDSTQSSRFFNNNLNFRQAHLNSEVLKTFANSVDKLNPPSYEKDQWFTRYIP